MATLVGTEGELVEMLKHLIELDHDAVEAYVVAVERSTELAHRQALTSFQLDHERHISELGALVRRLGGTPPAGGDLKRILTRGKVVIGALAGDAAILLAMKSNEEDTNTAYERASARLSLPADVAEVLNRGLSDERRHREWIVSRLQQLAEAHAASVPPGA